MASRQVITITPTGGLEGLQRKPGQGIDLRSFGHAEIERASEIKWSTTKQAWYIAVLQEAGRGIVTNRDYFNTTINSPVAVLPMVRSNTKMKDMDKPMYFDEYDDAVKVEIAYLDALRLKGQF